MISGIAYRSWLNTMGDYRCLTLPTDLSQKSPSQKIQTSQGGFTAWIGQVETFSPDINNWDKFFWVREDVWEHLRLFVRPHTRKIWINCTAL